MGADLSIVIVSFNTRDLLGSCLRSIAASNGRVQREVFVVDNASEDGSADLVRREFPDVRLIANRENLGFARANNQALRLSTGRYALLLNSDTTVPADALERLVRFMDAHPDAGLSNPKLIYADGTLQPQSSKLPTFWKDAVWESVFWGTPIHRFFGKEYVKKAFEPGRDYDRTVEVDWVRGAAMVIRREVIEQIGLLDENFFFGHEEIDYCIRARQAGWKCYYVADAVVVHHGSMSHGPFGRDLSARIQEGRLYFWEKHGGRGRALLLRSVIGALALATMQYRLGKLAFARDRRAELRKYRTDLRLLRMALTGAYPRPQR